MLLQQLIDLLNKAKIKFVILMLIMPGLFAFAPIENNAAQKNGATSLTSKTKVSKKKKTRRYRRKRRSYNPTLTRQKAIEIIRRGSETLCELAGFEPLFDGMEFDLNEDSEDVSIINGGIEACEVNLATNPELQTESDEFSDEELDNQPLDIETFKTLWLSYVDESDYEEYTETGIHKPTLMQAILDWLGTPYRFGGTTRKAIDCSAFTRRIYNEISNITLPRTARAQIYVGNKIRKDDLDFGDLIFFHTYSYRFASHVGIYLADGLFAHASSRYGVTVSSLDANYYRSHYIGARRLTHVDFEQYANN